MGTFICPRCGNKDEKYVGYLKGKPYCRLCISMKGETAKEPEELRYYPVLNLNYKLSEKQEKISWQIIQNFWGGIDTLIYAVCGAGKTELVYGVIQEALKSKKTVAFAVPRRDVVIELSKRIEDAFPYNKITCVYGGHNEELIGDIIVLTTHQLYRYPDYFDLIILDEIDAFPFNGNTLLCNVFHNSSRDRIVQMSATPSEEVVNYFSSGNRQILELNTRFHKHGLPVPKLVIKPIVFQIVEIIKLINKFKNENKQVFIFVPTIEICINLWRILRLFCKDGYLVHSKQKDRAQIIENFRVKKYQYLITTAVLERGVTVKNLQVIIFKADHELYNEYNLVQIAGRVGRKYDAPEGEVFFLASKRTQRMEKAKRTIEDKNRYL